MVLENGQEQDQISPKRENQVLKKRNPLILIAIVFFSIIILFLLARFAVPQVLVYLTQATRSTTYSLSNSYIFGSPLVAAADGETKVRINAFLLDTQGLGVPDKQIVLLAKPKAVTAEGSVQVRDVQPMTDKFGKTVFEVVSRYQGQFIISASVDGVEFPQTVTITFR